jgi:hypothetical protein
MSATQLLAPFDANLIAPASSSAQLPVGPRQAAVIIGSEIKATKDKTGGLVQFELQIIEGPNQGATGAYRINLYNSNDQARRIAESQFSSICHAVNVMQVQDTQQLHGIPFFIDVNVQKNDERYTEVSKVYAYEPSEPQQAPSVQTQQAPQNQPIQQAPVAQAAPWGAQQAPAQQAPTEEPKAWGQQPIANQWGTAAEQAAQQEPVARAPWSKSN